VPVLRSDIWKAKSIQLKTGQQIEKKIT
jgi:hypothetical protein